MENSMIFSQLLRYKQICSDRKDFIEHSKELVTHFLHIGYQIMLFQNNVIKQTKYTDPPYSYRENIDNQIPLVQIYHPAIVTINKSVIKEWKFYSNIIAAIIYFVIYKCAHIVNRLPLSACW